MQKTFQDLRINSLNNYLVVGEPTLECSVCQNMVYNLVRVSIVDCINMGQLNNPDAHSRSVEVCEECERLERCE